MKKMMRIAAGLAVFLMAAGAGCKEKEKVSTSAERTLVSEWTDVDGEGLLAFYSDGTFLIGESGTYRGDPVNSSSVVVTPSESQSPMLFEIEDGEFKFTDADEAFMGMEDVAVSEHTQKKPVAEWHEKDSPAACIFYNDGTLLVGEAMGTYSGDASKNGKITMEMEGEGEFFVIIKGNTLSVEGDDEIFTRVKN